MTTNSDMRQVFDFLRRLAANNDRTWFKAHKDEYDRLRKAWEADIARLIGLVGDYDDAVRGLAVRDAVYRIYRDVRFSPDKSPYKRYFSAVLGRGGRHTVMSSYYVHFEPGQLMLCGGVWWPERPILNRLRSLIDAEGDEFRKIVGNPELTSRYHWECDTLKTMPRDYSVDNPMAEYLKMKEYILVMRPDDDYFFCDDWVARVAADLRPLQPLHAFLNYVFDE